MLSKLEHEELRRQIARAGREKVLKEYSLQDRLEQILETATLG